MCLRSTSFSSTIVLAEPWFQSTVKPHNFYFPLSPNIIFLKSYSNSFGYLVRGLPRILLPFGCPTMFSFFNENFFRRAEQNFCGYWIRLTRNARSGKVGSSHSYLDRRQLHEIELIAYEYDRKQFHRLVYVALPRVILMRYLILYVCVDHGTCYKFYLKILKTIILHICLILIAH